MFSQDFDEKFCVTTFQSSQYLILLLLSGTFEGGSNAQKNSKTKQQPYYSSYFVFKCNKRAGFMLKPVKGKLWVWKHWYCCHTIIWKIKFFIKISSVNMTKSAISCGFGHVNWRNCFILCSVRCFLTESNLSHRYGALHTN